MEREVLLTGIGGQGIQLAAQILARAAMREGREVMTLGTYGGSMRGGNTDATVVVADRPISTPPIVSRAWSGVAMHPRSWDGVRARLRPGGVAAWNADLFADHEDAGAAHLIRLDATSRAAALGAPMAAGLVLLGAFAGATGLVGVEALVEGMRSSIPAYRQHQIESNERALREGFAAAPPGVPRAWEGADA